MKPGAARFTVTALGQPIPQPRREVLIRQTRNPSEPKLEVNYFRVALKTPDKLLSVSAAKRDHWKQGVNWVIYTVCSCCFHERSKWAFQDPCCRAPEVPGICWTLVGVGMTLGEVPLNTGCVLTIQVFEVHGASPFLRSKKYLLFSPPPSLYTFLYPAAES